MKGVGWLNPCVCSSALLTDMQQQKHFLFSEYFLHYSQQNWVLHRPF